MRVEPYNLGEDLGETIGLSEPMPEEAAELRHRLHAWRESLSAQLPTPKPEAAIAPKEVGSLRC
jgi:arylsulfatase A